jgi:hypothetical protein
MQSEENHNPATDGIHHGLPELGRRERPVSVASQAHIQLTDQSEHYITSIEMLAGTLILLYFFGFF